MYAAHVMKYLFTYIYIFHYLLLALGQLTVGDLFSVFTVVAEVVVVVLKTFGQGHTRTLRR